MGNMKRFPITNPVGDMVDKYRDPDEKLYASLELNQVAFPKTGMVVSQVPLGTAFTKANPCENGMWLVGDKSAGALNAPAAATDSPIGIVYTAEKEYDMMHYGLQRFGRKVAGDYPRLGLFGLGDTVTTNCLQYDDAEFPTEKDLWDALDDIATTPLYVGIVAGSPVPQLTATKPVAGVYAKVVKFYTIPNGGKGVKYQIVSLG
jgi:hypothetical protein